MTPELIVRDAIYNKELYRVIVPSRTNDVIEDDYVLNPKSGLANYLPNLVNKTIKTYAQYGWVRQSK